MLRRAIVPVVVWLAAFVTLAPAPVESQNEAVTSAVPRTSWGAPDLAGIWDFRTSTPLQRPEEFGDRASLTDEEAAGVRRGRRGPSLCEGPSRWRLRVQCRALTRSRH